jgi:hypothetical protein
MAATPSRSPITTARNRAFFYPRADTPGYAGAIDFTRWARLRGTGAMRALADTVKAEIVQLAQTGLAFL